MGGQKAIVPFGDAELWTVKLGERAYAAMRPITVALGLDWSAQYRRIRRHPVLAEGVMIMAVPLAGRRGGIQRMLFLPLELLQGWLFGVSVEDVRADLRDSLLSYQRECFQVLNDYWRRGYAENPRLRSISVPSTWCEGRDKTKGERFQEERERVERKYGHPLGELVTGMSKAKVRAIEADQGGLRIPDSIVGLLSFGMDLRYVLWGDRAEPAAMQAFYDIYRHASAEDQAELVRHAEAIPVLA